MKNKRGIAVMWLAALIQPAALAAVWGRLPEQVPTHFGLDGQADGYGSRWTLWLLAGLGVLFAVLFQIIPRLDPRRRNYEKFQKYYDLFAVGMELFLLAVNTMMLTEILHPGTVSMGRGILLLVSVLFILLGNMMGKIKPNYFFGIRTPWTMADPDVWTRTHRLCGWLWFVWGVVLMPCSLLLPERVVFWVLMSGVVGVSAVSLGYSYACYHRREKTE